MSKVNSVFDKITALDSIRELRLFIDNDYILYQSRFIPMIENLKRKVKRGVYDHQKAPKLFIYLVDVGARKYCADFGGTVRQCFPKAVREAVAQEYADEFKESYL